MDFEDTFASAAQAMEQANEQLEAQADAAPPPGDQPSYEMDVTVSSREGDRGVKRGLDARQFIVIVEVVAKDPEVAEQNGRMYMISDIWTASEFAGSETIAAFDRKLGEGVYEALGGSEMGAGMNMSFFNDPRMQEAMDEMAEAFERVEGMPVETTTYFVMGPENARLDLDAVLHPDPGAEADVHSMPGNTSGQPVQSQATLFKTKTFMTNLSTEPFDLSLLGDRGYTEIESPITQYLEESGE
ncbi:MAG: hypothetical protein HKN17_10800 [Rhodothermales bacterium]|nr:hypothetical protein [Rhodothermales bacterium]